MVQFLRAQYALGSKDGESRNLKTTRLFLPYKIPVHFRANKKSYWQLKFLGNVKRITQLWELHRSNVNVSQISSVATVA